MYDRHEKQRAIPTLAFLAVLGAHSKRVSPHRHTLDMETRGGGFIATQSVACTPKWEP